MSAVLQADVQPAKAAANDLYVAVFDDSTGRVRTEWMFALAALVVTILFFAGDGPRLLAGRPDDGTRISDAGAEPSKEADGADGDGTGGPGSAGAKDRGSMGAAAARAGPKMSMRELQALSKRRRAEKEKDPDSPLFWKSFRAKRRAVTAAALSAGSGKRGPAWAALAEADLTVRAWRLSRDGSGGVEYAVTGQSPARCGEVTGLSLAAAGIAAPSAVAGRGSRRARSDATDSEARLVAVTKGAGRFALVWRLGPSAGELGPPHAVVDLSIAHPGRVGRCLAPCVPPGASASVVLLTAALGDSKDTFVTAVPVAAAGGTAASPIRARPSGRVDVMQGRNYDMAMSPGRRWLGVAAHLADMTVLELHHDASDPASLATASMTRLSRGHTLPAGRAGHSGRTAGVVFPAPGVAPFLHATAGAPGLAAAEPAPPCSGRGDSSVAIGVSASGRWSAWGLDVPAKSAPELMASGSIDVRLLHEGAREAEARVTCVRVLQGSPMRLLLLSEAPGGERYLGIVALVDRSGSVGGDVAVRLAAGTCQDAGDAVLLGRVDVSSLGPVLDVQVSDCVSDAVPASHKVAGVGSDAARSAGSFSRQEATAASAWPSFVLTSHAGAASCKVWKIPAANESFLHP